MLSYLFALEFLATNVYTDVFVQTLVRATTSLLLLSFSMVPAPSLCCLSECIPGPLQGGRPHGGKSILKVWEWSRARQHPFFLPCNSPQPCLWPS